MGSYYPWLQATTPLSPLDSSSCCLCFCCPTEQLAHPQMQSLLYRLFFRDPKSTGDFSHWFVVAADARLGIIAAYN